MRPPEIRKYLFDVSQACELLAQFTAFIYLAHPSFHPLAVEWKGAKDAQAAPGS